MQPMRILSLDQSVTATAAVMLEEVDDAKFRITDQEVFKPKTTGVYRFIEIREWLTRKCNHEHPNMIVREQHTMRQFGAASQIQVIGGMIDMLAHDLRTLPENKYAIVPVGAWKKFCLGKGNLKKDTAYMMHINKFIQDTPYLEVSPDYQLLDDNIGDAVCMGITGVICRRILMELPAHIPDAAKFAALKKVLPSVFGYGKS